LTIFIRGPYLIIDASKEEAPSLFSSFEEKNAYLPTSRGKDSIADPTVPTLAGSIEIETSV